jgi:hypothetical protein
MKKLIFVYNADSGKWNAYLDMAHKVFSPSTYPCSLCDITYGIFKIRPEWEAFVANSPVSFEFLHKDEFLATYRESKFRDFPFILQEDEKGNQTMFLNAEELNNQASVSDLKTEILKRIAV